MFSTLELQEIAHLHMFGKSELSLIVHVHMLPKLELYDLRELA